MSFRVVKAAIAVERDSTLHEARLLLLLLHAGKSSKASIEGITKLAKMDFLVRYPRYLDRLVKRERKRPVQIPMLEFENETVESKMIRFRYGPWDTRYRKWIGVLTAKNLILARSEGRNTVHLFLTEKGAEIAKLVAESTEFQDLDERARIVCSVVGNLSGTRLKDLIYEIVPELGKMPWGEEIES